MTEHLTESKKLVPGATQPQAVKNAPAMPSKEELMRIGVDSKGNSIFLNQEDAAKAAIKPKPKKKKNRGR